MVVCSEISLLGFSSFIFTSPEVNKFGRLTMVKTFFKNSVLKPQYR